MNKLLRSKTVRTIIMPALMLFGLGVIVYTYLRAKKNTPAGTSVMKTFTDGIKSLFTT